MIKNFYIKSISILSNKGLFYFLFFNLNPKIYLLSKKTKEDINFIKKQQIIYQPVRFREITIPRKSDMSIIGSSEKLKKIKLPQTLKNKTVLDIGCAEGYFLIEAAKRGAKKVVGIDKDSLRVDIAKKVVNSWHLGKTISVNNKSYQDLSKDEKFETVFCFSVVHHQHGEVNGKNFLDTWQILTNPKYKKLYKNMLDSVSKIASHTKEITYWEYPFTYKGYKTKPQDVDFELLAKKWENEGIYKKVEFIGFSQRNYIKDRPLYKAYKGYKTKPQDVDFELLAKKWENEGIYKKVEFIGFSQRNYIKDRPLYKAYKYHYLREDKGFYMDFGKKSVKTFFTITPSVYSKNQQKIAFKNISDSYKYFNNINWIWSPKLLAIDRAKKTIEVERINEDTLEKVAIKNDLSKLKTFLNNFHKLEISLLKEKINYSSGTIKDFLIGNKRLYIVDFEKCKPKEEYEFSLKKDLLIDTSRRFLKKKIPINKSSLLLYLFLLKANLKGNPKKITVNNSKICFFGSFDPNYSRNRIIIKGLNENKLQVIEIRSEGFFPKRYYRLTQRFLKNKSKIKAIVVGFPGHYDMPLAFVLGKFYKKKVFYDIFASTFETYVLDRKNVKKKSFKAKVYYFLDWLGLKLADYVIVDTKTHGKLYKMLYNFDLRKQIVVPVGSDTDYFYPIKSNEDVDVVFYGSYQPLQGAETIIKAAKVIPEVKFRMIGEGKEREKVQNLALKLGLKNVQFINWLSLKELSEEINKAKITLGIFGSSEKSRSVIPNKVYDYAACAKPVITSNTSAIREVFNDNKNIVLVPPKNYKVLAEKINELINNRSKRQELSINGNSLFQRRFTPKVVVSKLMLKIMEIE